MASAPVAGVAVPEGCAPLLAVSQPLSKARAAARTASFPNPIMTDQNPLTAAGTSRPPILFVRSSQFFL
jgi:hypothetical protein